MTKEGLPPTRPASAMTAPRSLPMRSRTPRANVRSASADGIHQRQSDEADLTHALGGSGEFHCRGRSAWHCGSVQFSRTRSLMSRPHLLGKFVGTPAHKLRQLGIHACSPELIRPSLQREGLVDGRTPEATDPRQAPSHGRICPS